MLKFVFTFVCMFVRMYVGLSKTD